MSSESEGSPAFPPSPSELEELASDAQSLEPTFDDLEAELKDARSELEEYQALLQELPAIYEEKFRQQVHSTAQDIRCLLDERKELQQQVKNLLSQAPDRPRLVAAPAAARPLSTQPRSRFEVSLPGFLRSTRLDGSSLVSTSQLSDSSKRVLSSWRWSLFGVTLIVGAALIGIVLSRPQERTLAPVQKQLGNGLRPTSSLLRLSVRGGQSWILIEDLGGRKLLDVVLDSGETRTIRIDSGIKIRSGRPDLVFFAVDSAPAKQLGDVSDLDWTEIRPPA